MKNLDTILLAIVAFVWTGLTLAYATVSVIMMPNAVRVWGAGAVIFIILVILSARADKRAANKDQ